MAGAGSLVGSWVGWAKTKLLVDQATSSDDDPTPIYVLDEVVAALSGGEARAGVDAVCTRLNHRNPVVKQKALKLVTHIGRKGSPELRRVMARQSAPVRELLHYRCGPDPFKGDTVWKRVQEYAQEALNAIHGAPEAAAPAQGGLGGRIQGFGSDAGGGGGSSYGGGMMGFGSADVVQSGMQAVTSGMRSLGSKTGGLLRQDGYSSQLDGGSSAASSSGWPPHASSQPIVRAGGPLLAGSGVGAGAAAAAAAASQQQGSAAGAGAAERRLVDRVCTPAGLRAAPGRDDLQAFVDGISSLDGPTVARLLERKLEAGPWQSTLRALCAIEAVVEHGSSAACGQVAVAFQTNPEAVRRAADSPQASVRQRAQKLLALLGAGGSGQAAPGQQQQQQQQLFTEDLLGEAEPAAAAASTATAAGLADLLGEPAAAVPAAASSDGTAADLLAGLDVAVGTSVAPAALPAAPQPAAAADPFAGMLLVDQPPAAAVPAPPQQAAPSNVDLLGGLSLAPAAAPSMPAGVAPAPAAAPSPGALGDLLGGLSLGQPPAMLQPSAANSAALGSNISMAGAFLQQQQQPVQQAQMGGNVGLGMPWQGPTAGPMGGRQMQPPFSGSQQSMAQHSPFNGSQPGYGLQSVGSGAMPPHAAPGRLGSSGSTTQHGRQPSLSNGGGHLSMLGSSGIIDSPKDTSFNFVDDALAAARRKK